MEEKAMSDSDKDDSTTMEESETCAKEENESTNKEDANEGKRVLKPGSKFDTITFEKTIVSKYCLDGIRKFRVHMDHCNRKKSFIKFFLKREWWSNILLPFENKVFKHGMLKVIIDCYTSILSNLTFTSFYHKKAAYLIAQKVLMNNGERMLEVFQDSRSERVLSGFKCLRAIVAVGGRPATVVIKFLSRDQSKHVINRVLSNKYTNEKVHKCYLYLLLDLLSTDEPFVLDKFLSVSGILPDIIPGLMYKPCEEVLLFLNSFCEHILKNPNVNKERKVQIFKPETVKQLIHLYEWKGPRTKSTTETGDETDNKEEEAKKISGAVLKLLFILCTSYEYGIAQKSDESKRKGICRNLGVHEIISLVKKPWKTSYGQFLLVHTFAACPDILLLYLKNLEFVLKQRDAEFISLMEMLVEIVKHQKPWEFMGSLEWERVISCILLDPPVTSGFYIRLCQSDHGRIRFAGYTLMLTVLRKASETLEELKGLGLSSDDEYEKLEAKLKREVTRNFGGLVLKSLIDNLKYFLQRKCHNSEDEVESTLEESVDLQPVDEVLVIVEYLCRYSTFSTSPIDEVVMPLDVLKTMQLVSNMSSNDVVGLDDLTNFWKGAVGLLSKCMNHRKFNIGVESLEENIFHVIIQTNAHCLEQNKDFNCDLTDILSVALCNAGIVDDFESISHWLRHISGSNYSKLAMFLTHIIQQSERSYNHYTDSLIELKEEFTTCCSAPFLIETEPGIFDNEHVPVSIGYNKPFSRFVLAAVELLKANSDDEHKQYFSLVLNDYIHSLHNPGILISFLIERKSLISESLKTYLEYLVNYSLSPKNATWEVVRKSDITEVLKASFITQDRTLLNTLLQTEDIQKAVKGDIHLIVAQILLYMFVEHKNADMEVDSVCEIYKEILKKLYVTMKEKDIKSAAAIVKSVLEHPRVLMQFSSIDSNKSSISSLIQYFIEVALENHSDENFYTYPYFLKTLSNLKLAPIHEEACIVFGRTLAPFLTSENTILSYEDIEQLVVIYLKLPFAVSAPCSPLLHQMLSLLWKVTTPGKKIQEETVHLLFNKYLEYSTRNKAENLEIHNKLLMVLEDFLPKTLTSTVAQQISQGELKRLLDSWPGSAEVCCQLVKLHPPHGVYFASRFKKHSKHLSNKAQLLSVLLEYKESADITVEILPKLREQIKEWALKLTESGDHYEALFLECVKADIFDLNELSEICLHTHKETSEKVLPQRSLSYLLPVFERLSKSPESVSKLPFEDGEAYFLLILLNVIKAGYMKDGLSNTLLQSCYHLIETILPNVDIDVVKAALAKNKLWLSIVKQILRYGITDIENGPIMIRVLRLLIEKMYECEYLIHDIELNNELDLGVIYKMILSHTKYLSLMFQRDAEWDKLKENVVHLHQTIIDQNRNICLVKHIPAFLGAYGASMSAADQRILKLLHTYESEGLMYFHYPVIWGDAAVTYFAAQKTTNYFLVPGCGDIISLLKSDTMFKTCRSFDVNLPLEPGDILGDDRTIYDMRFIVPLMLWLSDNKYLREIEFAECGAVAVGFTCLTSHHKDMWAAGATLLKRVVSKMKSSWHVRLKLPWQWAITIVVSSFDGEQRRLPSVILHFLLHVVRLLASPRDPMYFPMLRSLFIRPKLEFLMVPQFSRLCLSSDINNNKLHKLFLLDFLSTGIRYPEDYYICQKTSTANIMMALFQSPTTDYEVKEKALRVIESMVRIPNGAHDLVNQYNLLMLLPITLKISGPNKTFKYNAAGVTSVITAIVSVLSAVWTSMSTAKGNETSLKRRLDFNPTLKRKREEQDKDEDISNSSSSSSSSSDEDSDEKEPSPKKAKGDNGKIEKLVESNVTKDNVTDMEEIGPENKSENHYLHHIFVEDYLNCLLCITSDVIQHASPECVAKYVGLIISALNHLLLKISTEKKESIHAVAQNPDILKERIHSSLPWELLLKLLGESLTEAELIRILGSKAEGKIQNWRKQPLSEYQKREDTSNEWTSCQELKTSIFNLLDVLGQ